MAAMWSSGSFGKVVKRITSRSVTSLLNHRMHIITGESIDPRMIEAVLPVDPCPIIVPSCVVRNNPPVNSSVPFKLSNLQVILRILPPPCSLKSHAQLHRSIVVSRLPFAFRRREI